MASTHMLLAALCCLQGSVSAQYFSNGPSPDGLSPDLGGLDNPAGLLGGGEMAGQAGRPAVPQLNMLHPPSNNGMPPPTADYSQNPAAGMGNFLNLAAMFGGQQQQQPQQEPEQALQQHQTIQMQQQPMQQQQQQPILQQHQQAPMMTEQPQMVTQMAAEPVSSVVEQQPPALPPIQFPTIQQPPMQPQMPPPTPNTQEIMSVLSKYGIGSKEQLAQLISQMPSRAPANPQMQNVLTSYQNMMSNVVSGNLNMAQMGQHSNSPSFSVGQQHDSYESDASYDIQPRHGFGRHARSRAYADDMETDEPPRRHHSLERFNDMEDDADGEPASHHHRHHHRDADSEEDRPERLHHSRPVPESEQDRRDDVPIRKRVKKAHLREPMATEPGPEIGGFSQDIAPNPPEMMQGGKPLPASRPHHPKPMIPLATSTSGNLPAPEATIFDDLDNKLTAAQ